MKVSYKTIDGRFGAEFEGTELEVFQQVARFEEIFGNTTCSNGKESSDKVVFVTRKDKEENLYLEQVCVDDTKPALRFAKRRFGQNKGKDGNIFPKNNGRWIKYDREQKVELDLITGKPVEKKVGDE
jgi:hypothetical protein